MNETLNIDELSVLKIPGVISVTSADQAGLSTRYTKTNDSDRTKMRIAARCIEMWHIVGRAYDLRHVIFAHGDKKWIISAHGNLLIEVVRSVNLGLLFRSVSDLPVMYIDTDAGDPTFENKGDAAIWRVIQLIARCETPRQMEFDIGGKSVILSVNADGFGIVSGADDVRKFTESVRKCADNGGSIRYTLLGDAVERPQRYAVSDLLSVLGGEEKEGTHHWQTFPFRLPTVLPANPKLEVAQMMLRLASVRAGEFLDGSSIALRAYDKARNVVMEGRLEIDGLLKVNIYRDCTSHLAQGVQ